MLIGLDPVLGPDLLSMLRAMGHGDAIAVVDGNFPAASVAKRLVRADGHHLIRVMNAILSVLPIDTYDGPAVFTMAVVGDADAIPPAVVDIHASVAAHGYRSPVAPIERHAFYDRARACFAIVATSEKRLYGNVIIRKGVVDCEATAARAD